MYLTPSLSLIGQPLERKRSRTVSSDEKNPEMEFKLMQKVSPTVYSLRNSFSASF